VGKGVTVNKVSGQPTQKKVSPITGAPLIGGGPVYLSAGVIDPCRTVPTRGGVFAEVGFATP
jgi:hypothetical protein